jgi:hypothetical protein
LVKIRDNLKKIVLFEKIVSEYIKSLFLILEFIKASTVYLIISFPLIFSSNLFVLPNLDDVPPAVITAEIFIFLLLV